MSRSNRDEVMSDLFIKYAIELRTRCALNLEADKKLWTATVEKTNPMTEAHIKAKINLDCFEAIRAAREAQATTEIAYAKCFIEAMSMRGN